MGSLGKAKHEEFAANFADSLASAATAAGEHAVSRQVYETLLERYADSPNLHQKVRDELARLALVGNPTPLSPVADVMGDHPRGRATRQVGARRLSGPPGAPPAWPRSRASGTLMPSNATWASRPLP